MMMSNEYWRQMPEEGPAKENTGFVATMPHQTMHNNSTAVFFNISMQFKKRTTYINHWSVLH